MRSVLRADQQSHTFLIFDIAVRVVHQTHPSRAGVSSEVFERAYHSSHHHRHHSLQPLTMRLAERLREEHTWGHKTQSVVRSACPLSRAGSSWTHRMHRAHFAHISVGIAGTRVTIGESTALTKACAAAREEMGEMVVSGSMFVGRKKWEDRLQHRKIEHTIV